MNQISPITRDIIRHATGAQRPAFQGSDASDAVRDVLDAAWRHVFAGERATARIALARLVIRHQPCLGNDPALLAETVAVLAASHGFQAIGRLLRAFTGHRVAFTPSPQDPGPGLRHVRIDGAGWLQVTPECLADPARALEWSERLLRRCARS